jgi:hypothetical protein
MRTTLDLNDRLLREAKKYAAEQGTTLRDVVENALRVHLSRPTSRTEYAVKWRTERGRLLPGVQIEDRDSLFDVLDGRK